MLVMQSPFLYLQFDDRSKRRIMAKGENVYFYEPGAAAEDRGDLVPYFIELLEAFYRRYAERTGRTAPPPSILS